MAVDHHAGREDITAAVRAELMGPDPHGTAVEVTATGISYPTTRDSYGPHVESGTGEEILGWDRPLTRYGVGVLFPASTVMTQARADDPSVALPELTAASSEEANGAGSDTEPSDERLVDAKAASQLEDLGKRLARRQARVDEDGSDDLDLRGANLRKPCTTGVSFAVHLPAGSALLIEANGGRYRSVDALVREDGRKRKVWVRSPWQLQARFVAEDLHSAARKRCHPSSFTAEGLSAINGQELDLRVEAFARPLPDGSLLVTVTLVNRSRPGRSDDAGCAFQVHMTVRLDGPGGHLLPYPSGDRADRDTEEASFALLYRHSPVYGIGHGCAADWGGEGPSRVIRAEAMPSYEVPSITADVERPDGSTLSIAMAPLAGYVEGDDGSASLDELVTLYEEWIEGRQEELNEVDERHRPTAVRHLERCRDAAIRMREGLELIQRDEQVRRAFQLANAAVLVQQLRSDSGLRTVTGSDAKAGRLLFSSPYPRPDPSAPPENRGRWRAFQIAFLLMSLRSTAEGEDPHRDTVELIWFPTGGGKTEAYLGLTAFSLFLRRLRDPADDGVDVLMRYTLRLLTAQQFQRAARLVCAMEVLRRENADLGDVPYSIGIWVGGSTTPNTHKQARGDFKALQRGNSDRNPFLLTACPWCGAQMGLSNEKRGDGRRQRTPVPRLLGARQQGDGVILHCPDADCDFVGGLPVHVTDEAVYEQRPSIVIGTVDKFAMMAWRDQPRRLFGLGADGEREVGPPNLIIQDELHLISGPLGSLVGLYEMVIEQLSTDERQVSPVRPKLVASTATIRRYEDQVRALYARGGVELFPPSGLEAGDSFFARYARGPDGSLAAGRRYLGVHASNHTSLITTQVNVMAALLQAPVELPEEARDPWWTQLVFFNNLRELGSSLSLVASNVPMQVRSIGDRTGRALAEMRTVRDAMELTSRLQSHEVPTAIQRLEATTGEGSQAVDVCLASNIIEVGIDIDRLSLLVIVGQPKTTSQYIQISGRVGRRWQERPGLVVTLLNPGRARDRSHFEQFRAYHQRLYAQVEPTSVTPFSPPALDRALHGALLAYLRQRIDLAAVAGPSDVPAHLLDEFVALATERVAAVDPSEAEVVRAVLDKRLRQLASWGRMLWESPMGGEEVGLLSHAGQDAAHVVDAWTWPTPTSMRSVDAECEVDITKQYVDIPEGS
jgi:hypothetical protein